MSSSINKNVNVERRTWDKETFEARARTRADAELAATEDGSSAAAAPLATGDAATEDATSAIKNSIDPIAEKEEFVRAQSNRAGPMGSDRAFLKSRSRKVDLESKLGSSEIIDPAAAVATKSKSLVDDINSDICSVAGVGGVGGPLTPSSGVSKCTDGVGWHCRVCDCFLKDSLTYLDHINGRKHQRYLGYSMRVEKSTTEEVSGVLKGLADKKRERNGLSLGGSGSAKSSSQISATAIDFEDVVRKKDEEALRRKADRARRREKRKRRGKKEEPNNNGSSGQVNLATEITIVEEKQVTKTEDPAGGKDGEEEEEDDDENGGGIDPALAAMMGFSGFGGSRK